MSGERRDCRSCAQRSIVCSVPSTSTFGSDSAATRSAVRARSNADSGRPTWATKSARISWGPDIARTTPLLKQAASRSEYGNTPAVPWRRPLLAWYRRHRRDLPWRRDRDPYRVWVSEVMLQQTRIATATPYYQRFLRRFPDVSVLA